jgi:hypothetical protein
MNEISQIFNYLILGFYFNFFHIFLINFIQINHLIIINYFFYFIKDVDIIYHYFKLFYVYILYELNLHLFYVVKLLIFDFHLNQLAHVYALIHNHVLNIIKHLKLININHYDLFDYYMYYSNFII